jgi:hypothetical protein
VATPQISQLVLPDKWRKTASVGHHCVSLSSISAVQLTYEPVPMRLRIATSRTFGTSPVFGDSVPVPVMVMMGTSLPGTVRAGGPRA